MPARRLSMRMIREVLRLAAEGLSRSAISSSLGVPRSTVRRYLDRSLEAGIAWPLPEEMTESELEDRLFPASPPGRGP